ncbi:MAG: hypothetical protein AAF548_13375 [Actinomycetota bacterium]
MSRFAASLRLPALPPVVRPLTMIAMLAIVAASCGRGTTLGPEEAVEVMVLDGVDRGRAVCIVDALHDDMDLAKVSGLDVSLDDDELRLLATTSAQCAPALALNGTMTIGGVPLSEATVAAEIAAADATIEEQVDQLVAQGLEFAVGQCVLARLSLLADAHEVLADLLQRSEIIVDCRFELGLTAG